MIINRRAFLGTAPLVIAAGSICLSPDSVKAEPAGKKLSKIGLQLYTLRNEMKADLPATSTASRRR